MNSAHRPNTDQNQNRMRRHVMAVKWERERATESWREGGEVIDNKADGRDLTRGVTEEPTPC